ncbi:MAG TPA: tripartite tricarboxylate transporter substrate binding protein [Ramlibacter sp.]|uniref:Bug family tripartite tricarboxylate transporter substrate binding protein n=1 Tax=Ramlibacter sp. TaxID=1917967 RepID=UPI002C787D99|nr:tripartite tricarboxylate transporter substrate binding protein [Ramlibacter sp.]HVZ43999.1 tripartite tricarboxylate transporter substrate binding protein [Ramlibacter sp.]
MMALARFFTAAACAACALAASAQTADFPSKPVHLVVPFAAGGPIDVLARIIGAKLATATGQQFIVENKAGGNSVIAWDYVARANPDGYTLLVSGIGSRTILPYVATIPFDPARDLVGVTRLADAATIFVANPKAGMKNLGELVTQARASPGKINVAIPAPATITHFAATVLQRDAAIKLTEVPYKGGAPAMNAVVGGEVEVMTADIGAVMPQIQAGTLVPLVVGSPSRLPMLPQVPTGVEAGYPNLVAVNVYGLFAPARTPKEVVVRLNGLVAEALRAADAREQLARLGMVAETSSADAFEAFMQDQTAKWSPIAKASGIRLN